MLIVLFKAGKGSLPTSLGRRTEDPYHSQPWLVIMYASVQDEVLLKPRFFKHRIADISSDLAVV